MGYSSSVHTWYGWKVKSDKYMDYFESLDFDLPEGFKLLGVEL
jgi:hypothetical protein